VPGILAFYRREGRCPDAFTAHYADGGLAGVLLAAETGIPFTFTAHSLALPDCARFAQHVAARKLATVGPLTERIDRHALYAELRGEKYL